jgi:hypothetical protein
MRSPIVSLASAPAPECPGWELITEGDVPSAIVTALFAASTIGETVQLPIQNNCLRWLKSSRCNCFSQLFFRRFVNCERLMRAPLKVL